MRGLLKSQTLLEMVVATIILAFVANSYELVCTAALPFVYDNLLLAQGISNMEAFMYIALYCAVYIIPLLVIVLVFVKKFEREKMEKGTGETLKAISGFMMLGFGFFLLVNPDVLSNIGVIVGIVLFAVLISLTLRFLKSRYKANEGDSEAKGKESEEGAEKEEKGKTKKKTKKGNKNESAKKS
jgi:hypothetical protein